MPKSSMGADVGKLMYRIGTAVEKGRVKTVREAAADAERVHVAALRPATGGDLNLSGVGKSGASVGVSTRVKTVVGGAEAFIRATGPMQLIESDTAGRVIRSKYSRGTGASGRGRIRRRGFEGPVAPGQFGGGRRAVLNIPGVGFRRSARHPGTKGQEPWAKGRKKAEPKIRTTMRRSTWNVVSAAAKP